MGDIFTDAPGEDILAGVPEPRAGGWRIAGGAARLSTCDTCSPLSP